jgi:fluoride exporter
MIWKLLSIATGGALGAIMRYSVTYFQQRHFSSAYPWATFFVNLLGAFLIGLFWGFFEKSDVSENIKSFVLIGLIGSFTTFSTLSLETVKLFQTGNVKMGLFYVIGSNVLGILFVVAGFWISRQINVFLTK